MKLKHLKDNIRHQTRLRKNAFRFRFKRTKKLLCGTWDKGTDALTIGFDLWLLGNLILIQNWLIEKLITVQKHLTLSNEHTGGTMSDETTQPTEQAGLSPARKAQVVKDLRNDFMLILGSFEEEALGAATSIVRDVVSDPVTQETAARRLGLHLSEFKQRYIARFNSVLEKKL